MNRSGLCSLGITSLLLSVAPAESAVFNYSAQLENVLAKVYGTTVEYSVFDPDKGRFVGTSESRASIQNLINEDGILAWTDGAIVYARFYDPNRGAWRATQVTSAAIENMIVRDGVLVWNNNTLVNQLVYDLCRGAWRLRQDAAVNPVTRLDTAAGLAVWNGARTVYHNVYDPVRGLWVGGTINTAVPAQDLMTRHGIMACSSGSLVYVRTYDPEISRWIGAEINSGAPSGMRIDNGVVAWTASSRVHYAVYDPMQQRWISGSVVSGPVTDLNIHHSTVTFTGSARTPMIRGYSVESGRWFPGTTVPYASFGASSTSDEAPKTVYFFDRSLGASGWGWNFDDGGVRFERSPHHTFSEASVYRVSQMVHGPHGMTSGAVAEINLTGEGEGTGASANAPTSEGADYQTLESSRTAEGLLQVTIHGAPGEEIELQASGNFSDWTTLATLGNSTGTVTFVDPDSAHMEHRFYRARSVAP